MTKLDQVDVQGRTLAHHAVLSGCEAFISLLKEKGADFSQRDKEGKTPFYLAVEGGQLGMVQCLMQHEVATPHIPDSNNVFPIQVALKDEAIAMELLNYRGSVGRADADFRAQASLNLVDLAIEADAGAVLLQVLNGFEESIDDTLKTYKTEKDCSIIGHAAVYGSRKVLDSLNQRGYYFSYTGENQDRLKQIRKELLIKKLQASASSEAASAAQTEFSADFHEILDAEIEVHFRMLDLEQKQKKERRFDPNIEKLRRVLASQ